MPRPFAPDPSTPAGRLAARLDAGFLSLPGVYDGLSARVAAAAGAEALYMTGFGTVASHLGLPDAGLASYRDMVERVRTLAGLSDLPLIADADTGYGGLLNVAHTVEGYARAGAAAIQIEDQEFPKKCGHTSGRRVVSRADAAARVRVAAEARDAAARAGRDAPLILARTDARSTHGLDEALFRAESFLNSGADILFVEAPETEEELVRIGRAFDAPLLVNAVEGGTTPVLPAAAYEEMGFSLAIYPLTGLLAAARVLARAYGANLAGAPAAARDVPLEDFAALCALMGFPDVHAFERAQAGAQTGGTPAADPDAADPDAADPDAEG